MNRSTRFLFLISTRERYFLLSRRPQYHNTASAPTNSMRASIPPAAAPPSLALPSPFELAEYKKGKHIGIYELFILVQHKIVSGSGWGGTAATHLCPVLNFSLYIDHP